MVVGVCRLSLFFPESNSLKTKRQFLRKIIDRIRAKYTVAIAEVGDNDKWQRAVVGLSVVGNEGSHVQSMLDTITAFVEHMYIGQLLNREIELLTYSDHEQFSVKSTFP